ncbi:2-C-methyl-D-erythritol 4-phosphate cytidylyltransferase [Aquaspirillum sp. LM1]|uniref:2-C-methyl-D-erythritol 4-phosphate cytidylyltransferase n=1 Tax=Aquaspirillum sp. LM1 TaxID=1938604 RepID=UPI000983E3DC|nr:2-C-methyl-D-erythritol 4-phosphate cytidylyltransferase [Aquaspirillum sp. LM1]AQR64462.1 2-C-methyl-D-erythritol 4-phosphate cytidylyltransferase [Aquaspirillum sp. LM1]
MKPRCVVLVPAAGSGSRFGQPTPKQYTALAGQPLLAHTLRTLCAEPRVDQVWVVISPEDDWFDQFDWPDAKLGVLRHGGATRAETVRNGLAALALADDDWVLVHDAARCCLPADALTRLIDTLDTDPCGGLLALPVADTLKRDDGQQGVAATVARDGLWQAQTPQMFRYGLLARALAAGSGAEITDEASAIERLGRQPRLVRGDARNFKVTYAQDIRLAAALLSTHKDDMA